MSKPWSASACVKVIKNGSDSSAKPVWVMPLFGGTTSCFDELFNSFDGYKRSVYGITDPYLAGNDAALTMAFDEWIAIYIDAILANQASGPFTLIGYSQGMNWCWAIAEALAKKGHATDSIVVLDPNFPSWNHLDKVAIWNGRQFAASEGAPFFIIKRVMGFLMQGLAKKAQWDTQGKRELTAAALIADQNKEIDHFESLLIQAEMDTGVEMHPKPSEVIKKWPIEERKAETGKLVASKLEGVPADFIEKCLDFRAVTASRWFNWKPYVLPKDVKVTILFADRAHFGYEGSYCAIQGFDRFVEGGLAQIDEPTFVKVPKKKTAVTQKFTGMSKAWELHFRMMHYKPGFPDIKARALDKIGLFSPSAKCVLPASELVPTVEEEDPPKKGSALPMVAGGALLLGAAAYFLWTKFM